MGAGRRHPGSIAAAGASRLPLISVHFSGWYGVLPREPQPLCYQKNMAKVGAKSEIIATFL